MNTRAMDINDENKIIRQETTLNFNSDSLHTAIYTIARASNN